MSWLEKNRNVLTKIIKNIDIRITIEVILHKIDLISEFSYFYLYNNKKKYFFMIIFF